MIVTVFRSRVRPGFDVAQLEPVGARMYELAIAMPGFVSYKDFAAQDGEVVSIVEFQTMEDTLRWRNHPEHRVAQALGRSSAFSEYCVQVCELVRESRFP